MSTTSRPSEAEAARPAADIGLVLRQARERAGLSVRDLAGRLGVSPSTVVEGERGCDVRHSTLLRYLRVLPALSPHALLGEGPAPPPISSPAVADSWCTLFGFTVARLRYEVSVGAGGERTAAVEASGIRSLAGDLREPAHLLSVMQLLFRGSPAARRALRACAGDMRGESLEIADGCFRHAFSFPRTLNRTGFGYTRRQVVGEAPPPGFAAPGSLVLSAPFGEGISFAVEHPVEILELAARFEGAELPRDPRAGAWTDLQSVTSDESDLAPFLHPDGLAVKSLARRATLEVHVERPVVGLHYGIGWAGREQAAVASATASAQPAPSSPQPPTDASGHLAAPRASRWPSDASAGVGAVLRQARERAGLSQRQLAARVAVSPVTVANVEGGHDPRRSTLVRCLGALPDLAPEALLPVRPPGGTLSRQELWEYYRALIGIEADEERKTLVITAEGDAHAVCESRRVRRVRPGRGDLRIRYSSVQALGKRLPTVLKAIEDEIAAEAEDSGLRARVVARRAGRLIHEITVPRDLAQVGASYTRRLYDARFFDPKAEPSAEGEGARHYDGAALVPFHAVRRLRLVVKFQATAFPERAWFAAHPRMMLEGPLPEADLSARLHPEGLGVEVSRRERVLALEVEHPLVGFMYDVFWERP